MVVSPISNCCVTYAHYFTQKKGELQVCSDTFLRETRNSVLHSASICKALYDYCRFTYAHLYSKSYDPDGHIISYLWEINHKEDPAYSLTALGEIVNISDLKQGFYDVVLTVTDNEGFLSTDKFLLAVKGPEPQCEYTYEDVEEAYDTGYTKGYIDGKIENQAIYNGKSRKLYIPEVVINGDVYELEMKRMGQSNIFKLKKGFKYIKDKERKKHKR